MNAYNNRDKLSMIELLFVLNMLQEPYCTINSNKKSKKKSKDVKHNISPNTLSVKKDWKDKMNDNFILPIQEINIENDAESIFPLQEVNIEDDTESILPLQEVNIKDCNKYTKKNIKKKDKITTINDDIHKAPKNIITNTNEDFISTLPIIIGEKNIDIPIELIFKLKNSALDVKSMKKDVYLTACKLLPLQEKDDISHSLNGKLFLEGFVRNKLDFSIAKSVQNNIINLETECVIIYIPFKCTSLIQYNVPPVLSKEKTLDYVPIYISSDCEDINDDYHKNFNAYLNKKNTQCKEYINCDIEAINCEIKEVKIHETYTLVDKTPFNKDFPIEINFNTIKENIIINLSLTFFQKQDVAISSIKEPK